MLELTLPVAKVRARINGSLPSTPRALKVFEVAASLVRAKHTICDMGLANGALCTDKAVDVLCIVMPKMFTSQYNPLMSLESKEVIHFSRNVDWKRANGLSPWAVESAKLFVEACIRTCAGIDLA